MHAQFGINATSRPRETTCTFPECMYVSLCMYLFLVPCPTNPRSLICLISASSAQMRWVSLPSCHLQDERKCFVLFICFPGLGHHCPLSPVSPYVEVVASYTLSSFIFLYIEYNSSLTLLFLNLMNSPCHVSKTLVHHTPQSTVLN